MSTSFMSMVLVACLATTASAQSLSVRITDDKGEPIWGAAFSWRPIANAQWTAGIRSDSAGRVGVQPGPGRVILTAHAIGFFSRSDTVMVTNGEAADHQMTLRRQRWIPFVGVHVGGPAVGSLAIGPAVLTRPAGSHPPRTDQGLLFAVVEPGVEAGRVSAGFLPAMGQMGSGVQARATILRKWKTPTQTFVGGELTLMPFFVMGPRIGVFNRIRGGAGWFVFVDFGFGG